VKKRDLSEEGRVSFFFCCLVFLTSFELLFAYSCVRSLLAGKYFAAASAVLAPKGLMIRSSQIVGSFVLLNGISHLLDVRLWGK